jgi:hypothetical protein
MKTIFDHIITDDNPYTHPMLTPVTALGYPIGPSTKTGPVGECREPEQRVEKIVKERLSILNSNILRTDQGEN